MSSFPTSEFIHIEGHAGYRSRYVSRVKCDTCKKVRMQSAFSKRQLDSLRNAIVLKGTKALAISGHGAKCRQCVGGQTVELKCCICDKIKGLDEFAKSQRQNRDSARCLNCVQNHAEADPVLEEHKLLTEGEFSTIQDTTVTASQIDDGSLIESRKRYNSVTRDGSDEDDDDLSVGGGVWVETERGDENSTNKGKGLMFTAFDPQGNAHRRTTQSGPGSIHSGWASLGVTPRTLPPPNQQQKKRTSNFAKVPGKRFEKHEAPTMRVPEPAGEIIPSDDEDEDEGIEDFL
ncbi:hypothetical protein ASPWEDRAFT_44552 [Aspergillus wentii DTO 134E9]|uniref:Stc1 domain-containing protein n=1 Tax=Aspergillus wentii DTO 134E9 TaxID=1073089 RepID=A0A1L9RBZ0_ASPWE|nr:uncharacterized protein ASPWEDRAFT_44552 [Aspergillus wentii DTO 134E9]OJJ32436.1 hypothetical protein ASPWEDRAFT_44552 [Aspergillus wentii DTO 134E9]